MKRLLLVATLLGTSFAFGQALKPKVLGEKKSGSFSIKRTDDVYSVCFEDYYAPKKNTIKCFSFIGDASELRKVYDAVMVGFATKEKSKSIKLPINTADVSAVFVKKRMRFEYNDNVSLKPATSLYLDKDDFQELFGMD